MEGELYQRKDKKFGWRVRAANNKIVAGDSSQGYERKIDCREMFHKLFPNLPLKEAQ
jgi:uncharacterized protein YegP (UPF0339 family)